jgi:Domain of unknown function (DUF1990)
VLLGLNTFHEGADVLDADLSLGCLPRLLHLEGWPGLLCLDLGGVLVAATLDCVLNARCLRADQQVTATIRAFSRPASLLARIGGRATHRIQARATQAYLDALTE